jgi:uncharacterized protein
MSISAENKNFREMQYAFTRHIRDPDNQPAPDDIEDRRMQIYRGLLYRNVEGFIAQSFPVLKKIMPDNLWHAMIRDYFKRHLARTPLFPKMPQEFLQYLEQERVSDDDPVFLLELAHYEWIELALNLDIREIDLTSINPKGNLLDEVPVPSPLIWPLCYQYPVHRISPNYQPVSPPDQPTYLVVYRNRNDKIGFIELNPVSARLTELIQQDKNRTGRALLEQVANELDHPDTETVIKGGLDTMLNMLEKDILLGTKKTVN